MSDLLTSDQAWDRFLGTADFAFERAKAELDELNETPTDRNVEVTIVFGHHFAFTYARGDDGAWRTTNVEWRAEGFEPPEDEE